VQWILLSVQNFLFSLCQYVIVLSLCVGMWGLEEWGWEAGAAFETSGRGAQQGLCTKRQCMMCCIIFILLHTYAT